MRAPFSTGATRTPTSCAAAGAGQTGLGGIGLFDPNRSDAPTVGGQLFIDAGASGNGAAGPDAEVIDLGDGRRATVRRLHPWVVRDRFRVCYRMGTSSRCAGTSFESETRARLDPRASFQQRTFTPMPTIAETRNAVVPRAPDEEIVVEYTYPLSVGPPGEFRELETLGPWRIAGLSGVDCASPLPAARVIVAGGSTAVGASIVLTLRMAPQDPYLDGEFPPAVIERPVPRGAEEEPGGRTPGNHPVAPSAPTP